MQGHRAFLTVAMMGCASCVWRARTVETAPCLPAFEAGSGNVHGTAPRRLQSEAVLTPGKDGTGTEPEGTPSPSEPPPREAQGTGNAETAPMPGPSAATEVVVPEEGAWREGAGSTDAEHARLIAVLADKGRTFKERRRATYPLRTHRVRASLPVFGRIVVDPDEHPVLRDMAAMAFAEMGGEEELPVLARLARQLSAEAEAGGEQARGLLVLTERGITRIEKRLAYQREEERRRLSGEAGGTGLGSLGEPPHSEAELTQLISILEDDGRPDEDRRHAADVLLQGEYAAALPAFTRIALDDDEELELRIAALFGFSLMGGEKELAILNRLVEDLAARDPTRSPGVQVLLQVAGGVTGLIQYRLNPELMRRMRR